MKQRLYTKYVIIIFGLLGSSFVPNKRLLKSPEKLIMEIITEIHNQNKWESNFISLLQEKFKIRNDGFTFFYRYDRKPKSIKDTIIYVHQTPSNLNTVFSLEEEMRNNFSWECYQAPSVAEIINKITVNRHIQIGCFPSLDFDSLMRKIGNSIGPPNESKNHQVSWLLNNYRISIEKDPYWCYTSVQIEFKLEPESIK